MTSESAARALIDERTAFVWIWLPGATDPVVAGRIDASREPYVFTYGRSYLARESAVPIFAPELPLRTGNQTSASGPKLPLCLDDAMPDSWGRRVVNRRLGDPTAEFHDITYLLASGSNRIGALDFQRSAESYVARDAEMPALDDLAAAADAVTRNEPVDARLQDALLFGTAIGGARPKAMFVDDGRQLIAKFTTSTDTFAWVSSEFVAMELARRCGLRVAPVSITTAAGRDVLLVERFDRTPAGERRRVVSALTMLGLNTFPDGRYATYFDIAHHLRRWAAQPALELRELFARIAFNMLCGNTDDHGRNHAVFVDDDAVDLTPAYDVAPQPRTGSTAGQALAFTEADRSRDARLQLLVAAAATYLLEQDEARDLIAAQIRTIRANWDDVCAAAKLSDAEQASLWRAQFLNPHIWDRS